MNRLLKKAEDKGFSPIPSGKNSVRQLYHLEPEKGLLNDPVGLIQFRGEYHVFFQWNSHAKDHSSKEWGHFSSPDLLSWKWHASPLQPEKEYDLNGVYSGSSVEWDGKIFTYYTGNRKTCGTRITKQCLAMSDDGIHFEKQGPVLEKPETVTDHFRDPNVRVRNGHLEMLIGAQNLDGFGEILQFTSTDGLNWSEPVLYAASQKVSMIECPDLIETENGNILLYCLQNRDPLTDECLDSTLVFRILGGDRQNQAIDLDTEWKTFDSGFDCYAAQTMKTEDGRILVFSWMNRLDEEQEKLLADAADNVHCLTLPRDLSVENGRLLQKPAKELYALFSSDSVPSSEQIKLSSRSWRAELNGNGREFSLKINEREAQISWSPELGILTLFRWDWAENEWQEKSITLRELNRAEIFMDTSSLEIFINDGQNVFSARILPSRPDTLITLSGLNPTDLKLYPIIPGTFSLEKTFQE